MGIIIDWYEVVRTSTSMIIMACGVETFTYSHDGTIVLSTLLAQPVFIQAYDDTRIRRI